MIKLLCTLTLISSSSLQATFINSLKSRAQKKILSNFLRSHRTPENIALPMHKYSSYNKSNLHKISSNTKLNAQENKIKKDGIYIKKPLITRGYTNSYNMPLTIYTYKIVRIVDLGILKITYLTVPNRLASNDPVFADAIGKELIKLPLNFKSYLDINKFPKKFSKNLNLKLDVTTSNYHPSLGLETNSDNLLELLNKEDYNLQLHYKKIIFDLSNYTQCYKKIITSSIHLKTQSETQHIYHIETNLLVKS